MWADAQRDGHPAEYRWCPLLNAADWLTPTARVPCSNAANTGELKTWTQSEFCTWQNSVMVQEPVLMYIYTVSQKNVPPLACYNFDTCERILIFFLADVLPIK